MEGLSKKERREARRQERKAEELRFRKFARIKRILWWIAGLVLLALIAFGIFYFSKSREPKGEDLSKAIEILPDRSHITRPTVATDYNSNPPTSGKHWSDAGAPTSAGVHEEEFPDEVLVHNLEHGEVWISYHPRIPEEVKAELRGISGDFSKVVLTPRAKNDTDIALAAWGRLDAFNLDGPILDRKRVEDFIKRWRNKGPELIP